MSGSGTPITAPESRIATYSTPLGPKAISLGPPPRAAPTPPPKPPSLILAGFSGGGATLKKVVLGSKADYISRLSEVWCLDCMYSGEGDEWVAWAKDKGNAKKKLRVRVSDEESTGSPRAQADVIRQSIKPKSESNIDIDKTIHVSHEGLPGKFMPGWLQP